MTLMLFVISVSVVLSAYMITLALEDLTDAIRNSGRECR